MFTVDFYYWNFQCPYNEVIKELLKKFEEENSCVLEFYDVSKDNSLAKNLHMYSPTLLVFNKKLRWNGPISMKVLKLISEGIVPERAPFKVNIGSRNFCGNIKYYNDSTVKKACSCCTELKSWNFCGKLNWTKEIMKKYNLPHLGLLNLEGEICKGGAEFVPSLEVPYDIPKNKKTAFLTCSYISTEDFDYRSDPLKRLEKELIKLGFNSIEAIASEEVMFPNGTLKWFLDRGYKDSGQVYYEKDCSAAMHLVEKNLEEV